jgi:4-hydroxy-4-methyl-2-oxoglutarate aldolase
VREEKGTTAMELGELCTRYRKLYLGTVCDALYRLGLPEQVLPTYLRPLLPETRIVGEAITCEGRTIKTVSWDEGVQIVRPYLEMFEKLTPDSILVQVCLSEPSIVGHWGELSGNAAQVRGCQGVILDGNIRDTEGMREIGFQVFYRDYSPLNAIGRWQLISSNVPVKIGDVTVRPSDIIFGEFDGVVVIPREQAVQVLLEAERVIEAEEKVRNEVREGMSPMASLERHGAF